jgi:hypothetical protein
MPPSSIIVAKMDKPPAPPENKSVIGATYDLGPSGLKFSKPVALTLTYSLADLPKGAREDKLVLATWDATAGKWVEYATTIDTVKKTLTIQIDHFSVYGILVPSKPATFAVSNLVVSPIDVKPGDTVRVTARVTNSGDLEASYKINLKVNGTTETSSDITLAGGAYQDVSFAVTKATAGTYAIAIDTASGFFTVATPVAPPTTPPPPQPKPATFVVSNMSVAPLTIKTGETSTIVVTVTNTGEQQGSYKVNLMVNSAVENTSEVTLAGAASQKVTFTLTKSTAGTYSIAVDKLTSTVIVEAPPPTTAPPTTEPAAPVTPPPTSHVAVLIGIIVAAIVVLGIIVYLFTRRKRSS